MVNGILDTPPRPVASGLQQWRQLCYLTTIDVTDPLRLLDSAAEIIGTGCHARVCMIVYDPPFANPLRATYGLLTPDIDALIAEAESRTLPRQRGATFIDFIDTRLTTLPLIIGSERVGMVHIVAVADSFDLPDVQMAVMMLNNALARNVATEHTRRAMRKALQRHQAMQHAITRVLSESASLGDATPIILQSFCESLEWELGMFWEVDHATQTLQLHAAWNNPSIDVAEFVAFCKGNPHGAGIGLPGRVWQSGEPGWVADVVQDSNFPGAMIAAKQRLRKAFAFPIRAGDEIRGVITLYSRISAPPDHNMIQLLSAFGSQISQFIERKRTETILWEREQEFRATFEQAAVGMAHVGLDGRWLHFNHRLCEIIGYTSAELHTLTFSEITHPDDLDEDFEAIRRMLAGAIQTYVKEKRYQRKDGTYIWVNLTVSLMRDATGAPQYFISVIEDIESRKQAEAETLRLTEELRQERDRLLRREIEVRTQIGRDLHDGPVQQVAVAVLTLQYLRRVALHAPERFAEALDDLEAQLKRTTQDMRTVLYELRPLGISEEGLVVVLKQYISRLRDPSGLVIHLDAPSDLRRLSPDHEAAMFIIVQEAINNVRKHANARNVWVRLYEDESSLWAEVRDDGYGFALNEVQSSYIHRGSFGLINMIERAQLLDGSCSIESQPGSGTVVRVQIPYSSTAEGQM